MYTKYVILAAVIAILFITTRLYKESPTKEREQKIAINFDYINEKLQHAQKIIDSGNIDEAINIHVELLDQKKRFSIVHLNLGKILYKKKEYEQAVNQFKKAIELTPNNPKLYFVTGLTLEKMAKENEAIKHFKKAVEINPNHPDYNLQLGRSLYNNKLLGEAEKYTKKAQELSPNNAKTYLTLGNIYNRMARVDESIEQYKKAMELDPNLAESHYNMGYSLNLKNKFQEALAYFDKALELNPKYSDVHLGLAQSKLGLGNFEECWDEFEWRWSSMGLEPEKYIHTMWNGSDIKNKTVLMLSEPCAGDTFQFLRYAVPMKKSGAKIILKAPKYLVPLLSLCPYIDQIVTSVDDSIKRDTYVQISSLPRIFKTTPQNLYNQPYLYADPKLVEFWKSKLEKDKNFKIGLCWDTNPEHDQKNHPWSQRSVPLKTLEKLSKIKGVSFYNLQKITGLDQLKNISKDFVVHTFGPDFDESHGRFMDTAALIKNLDLVITADTSIAHLVAAIGKPAWVMFPYKPESRWCHKAMTAAWYPTMKMFKSPKPFDWDSVVTEMANELKTITQNL